MKLNSLGLKLAIFLLLFLSASRLHLEEADHDFLVVWDVGQGQWATWVTAEACFHFDVGGERMPSFQIKKLCRGKNNSVYLSHWDWDHISFAGKLLRLLPRTCLSLPPEGKSSAHKMKMLAMFPRCLQTTASIRSIYQSAGGPAQSNDLSHVLLMQNKYLIPGDSTKQAEKAWATVPELASTKWLLLGHHGSRTSTSEELLQRLPRLKVAVASARFRKYGHPHAEVIARLRRHHVPLLRTEDWGHLIFQLN
jgi:competence protein ComEC